jgi:hypothetical protein
MIVEDYYEFQKDEFDEEGFHINTEQWFIDLIGEFEIEFHIKFPNHYANYLFANNFTMIIINRAMALVSDESCGMDLIDGNINLETNFEIEKYREIKTIYAIGSRINSREDEPIFLVVNDKISDNTILLKYISDDENEDDEVSEPLVNNLLESIIEKKRLAKVTHR